MIAVLSV